MKTIIATIKPIHLGNIRRGVKTIEVRKIIPGWTYPFKVLCCESGSGGQIKAEFVCRGVIDIYPHEKLEYDELLKMCCISESEMKEYCGDKKRLYGWCISDMIDYCSTKGYRIRDISEFGLKRAPQSWCYVKEEYLDTKQKE